MYTKSCNDENEGKPETDKNYKKSKRICTYCWFSVEREHFCLIGEINQSVLTFAHGLNATGKRYDWNANRKYV